MGSSPATSQRVTPDMKLSTRSGSETIVHTRSIGAATSMLAVDPHPITGKRRSAASASSVSCISRMTWS